MNRVLPIGRRCDRVLQITSNRRFVQLHVASFCVPHHGRAGVEVVGADLFFYTEEAAGYAVEEDGEIIGLVDAAAGAARLAVSHEGCGRFEIFEAFGAFHTCYAMVAEDVLVEVAGDGEGLPVTRLAVHWFDDWILNLLADERTVVLVDDGVVEPVGVPVVTHGIPETITENVGTVFVLHGLVVRGDGKIARRRFCLRIRKQH
jgi:hypothetical protein